MADNHSNSPYYLNPDGQWPLTLQAGQDDYETQEQTYQSFADEFNDDVYHGHMLGQENEAIRALDWHVQPVQAPIGQPTQFSFNAQAVQVPLNQPLQFNFDPQGGHQPFGLQGQSHFVAQAEQGSFGPPEQSQLPIAAPALSPAVGHVVPGAPANFVATGFTVQVLQNAQARGSRQALRLLQLGPVRQIELREPSLAPTGITDATRPSNITGSVAYIVGRVAPVECTRCADDLGPCVSCVVVDGYFKGSCSNCYYHSRDGKCSFRVGVDENDRRGKKVRTLRGNGDSVGMTRNRNGGYGGGDGGMGGMGGMGGSQMTSV